MKATPSQLRAACLAALALGFLWGAGTASANPVMPPSATDGMTPHGIGPALGDSLTAAGASLSPDSDGDVSPVRYSKRRLLVRFKPGTSRSERTGVRKEVDGKLITAYTIVPHLQLLRIPADADMAEVRQQLADDPNVAYALPDLIAKLARTPNDPSMGSLWGMDAINAPQAWAVGTGSREVVVGVVDSGTDYNHPDLRENIWTNPGEIPDNGQDDDGNGYIDDVHGIDPLNQDSDPMDDNGHGTHVAGTIGAVGNNSVGVAGVNWRTSLMPLKICDAGGSCFYSAAIEAMEYAIDNGASVTNHSWGGQHEPLPPFTEAVDAARQADQLFVAAAGNDATNNDIIPFNPAGTPVDNVISVGATGPSGALASFSNYGTESVDLAAPGEWILSTFPGSAYGTLSGTSMASPHVAGAAALLKSVNPGWSYSKIKETLLSSVTPNCSLAGKASTTGLLNIGAAVTGNTPAPKLCVPLSGSGSGSVTTQGTDLTCNPAFCEAALPSSGGVVLNASPTHASTFAGWSGACQGTMESCTLSGPGTKTAGARFDLTNSGPPGYSAQRIALPPANEIYQSFVPWAGTVFDLSADGNTRVFGLNHPPFRGPGCLWDNAANDRLVVQREVGGVWQQEAAIRTPFIGEDPRWRVANCDGFGEYIALSGDGERLFVGIGTQGVGADSNGVELYQCAVYLYERSAGWDRTAILKPPGVGENGVPETKSCQEFGFAFAVDHRGERIAVRTAAPNGSNGALVFVERSGQWVQEAAVELPETGCDAGIPVPDSISMSADGRHLVLGNWDSPGWNPDACKTAGYWARTDGEWELRQAIERPEARDAPPSHDFGIALSISADGRTLAISSTQSDDNPPWEGAAWVYERPGSTWQRRARLSSQEPERYGIFRCPTMNSDGSRILCTTSESVGFNQSAGRLYVFDAGEGWGSRVNTGDSLIDPRGESGDLLGKGGFYGGSGLAMDHSGTTLLVPKSPVNVRTGLYPDMHLGMAWTAPEPSGGPRLIGSVTPSAARGESILVRGYGLDQVQEFRIGGSTVDDPEVIGGSLVRLKIPQGASSGQITAELRGSAGSRSALEPVGLDTSPSASVESPSLSAIPGESPNVARFEFASPTADSFVCRVDDSAWGACSSPYTTSPALELGTHLFSVRAVEGAANSISSSLAFTTPVVAPPPPPDPPKTLAPPTIKSGPAKKTRSTTARFTFSGQAGSTFQCRLNSGAWARCSPPATYKKLKPGSHTFQVRQVDGERSSQPARYPWRILKKR